MLAYALMIIHVVICLEIFAVNQMNKVVKMKPVLLVQMDFVRTQVIHSNCWKIDIIIVIPFVLIVFFQFTFLTSKLWAWQTGNWHKEIFESRPGKYWKPVDDNAGRRFDIKLPFIVNLNVITWWVQLYCINVYIWNDKRHVSSSFC